MGRTSGPLELVLSVDRSSAESMRDQIARQIRELIVSGRLAPGSALPASRALADRLGVSRGVAVEAYADLRQQGFLAVRARSTPRVAGGAGGAALGEAPVLAVPATDAAPRLDLLPGRPDPGLFPRADWLRALRVGLASAPDRAFDEGDGRGQASLRAALAAHLGRTRGVSTTADRVIVCQGGTQAVELACRLLAGQGVTSIVVEDPCAPANRRSAARAGLVVVPVPVDDCGLVASPQLTLEAVLVTAAAQFPTGRALAAARAETVLASARFLIEDDRGAEHAAGGTMPPALQARAPERTLYVGSASQTLAPGLRLGWLVVPDPLVDAAAELRLALDGGSPTLDQLALAGLLGTAALDRHLRRVRAEYARRRDAFVDALGAVLPGLALEPAAAGLHLTAGLPEPVARIELAARARAGRIRIASIEDYLAEPPAEAATLVLSWARVPAAAARPAAHAIHRLLDPTAPAAHWRGPRRVPGAASNVAPGAAPGEESHELRVLTLDIHPGSPTALDAFARVAAALEPDVVCLQNPNGKTLEAARRIGFAHADPARHVVSRHPLVRPAADDYLLVEAAPSRFVAVANVHLSPEDYVLPRLLAGEERAVVVEAEHRIRIPELGPILATVRSLAGSGVPVVAAGSFNSPLEAGWPVFDALGEAGLRDVLPASSSPTWPVPGFGHVAAEGEERIDGMFAAGPADVLAAELVGEVGGPYAGRSFAPWVGEHRGILATLRVIPAAIAPSAAPAAAIVSLPAPILVAVVGAPAPGGSVAVTAAGSPGRRASVRRPIVEPGRPVPLPTGGLRPGAYDVLLLDPDGGELSRSPVWLGAPGAEPVLRPARRRFPPGEPLSIAWRDAPGHRWDYLALHRAGADIDSDDPVAMLPTGGRASGTVAFAPPPPGRYLVALMLDDGAELLAVCELAVRSA